MANGFARWLNEQLEDEEFRQVYETERKAMNMDWLLQLIPMLVKEVIDLVKKATEGDMEAAKRVAEILPYNSPLASRLAKEAADAKARKKFQIKE